MTSFCGKQVTPALHAAHSVHSPFCALPTLCTACVCVWPALHTAHFVHGLLCARLLWYERRINLYFGVSTCAARPQHAGYPINALAFASTCLPVIWRSITRTQHSLRWQAKHPVTETHEHAGCRAVETSLWIECYPQQQVP